VEAARRDGCLRNCPDHRCLDLLHGDRAVDDSSAIHRRNKTMNFDLLILADAGHCDEPDM